MALCGDGGGTGDRTLERNPAKMQPCTGRSTSGHRPSPQARPSPYAPWEGETQPCLTQLSKVAIQTAPMNISRPTEPP